MKTVDGDLLALARAGAFDVIAHGCNCFCAMGAGIALQVKRTFPAAYAADCTTKKGDRDKLGTCTAATIARADGDGFDVVNAYTQFHWSGPNGKADYDAIRGCMRWLKARYTGKRIGLPKIGAGLAGGDWQRIRTIIDEELEGEDVTVVVFG